MKKRSEQRTLSHESKETIKKSFNDASTILDFLENLTPQQRKKLYKLGVKGVQFLILAKNVVENHPGIIPADFDKPKFLNNVSIISDLSEIATVLAPLHEGIQDTLMFCGSEAANQANRVYDYVKTAAKSNSAVDEVRKEMAKKYQRRSKSTPPAEAK
jgi:hypothetical protein